MGHKERPVESLVAVRDISNCKVMVESRRGMNVLAMVIVPKMASADAR